MTSMTRMQKFAAPIDRLADCPGIFSNPGWAHCPVRPVSIQFRKTDMKTFIKQSQGRKRIRFKVMSGKVERYVHFAYIPKGESIGYGREGVASNAMVAIARSLGGLTEVTAVAQAAELAKITGTAYFLAAPSHLISMPDAGKLGQWVSDCLANSQVASGTTAVAY